MSLPQSLKFVLGGAALAAGAWYFSSLGGTSTEKLAELPQLGAKADGVTVSGISSGAYMAGQFQIAHAKIVSGAAIIAGGPYGCAESAFGSMPFGAVANATQAMSGCMLDMMWGVGDPATLADKAAKRAADGEIDALEDVKGDKVYLFTGKQDPIVAPAIVKRTATFYGKLGVPDDNIKLVTTLDAGHAFVTEDAGQACGRSEEPYVVDCDYDQAGELLRHIFGPLKARAAKATGEYVTFDQRPFVPEGRDAGLAEEGVVYIPKSCREKEGCRVHIAFHGCDQNRQTVQDGFIRGAGFARWADSNRIIVVFPQVRKTVNNSHSCWDWWGYTGPGYLRRDAVQIAAVFNMLVGLRGRGARS